jgi:hypothetical protein
MVWWDYFASGGAFGLRFKMRAKVNPLHKPDHQHKKTNSGRLISFPHFSAAAHQFFATR